MANGFTPSPQPPETERVFALSAWDVETGRLLTQHPLLGRGEEVTWHEGGYHLALGPEGLRIGIHPQPN
jgi:hypothetical protein